VRATTDEKLGAKLLNFLPNWKATCGGETFIALGMLTYWKDPVESPNRRRANSASRQHQFDPIQRSEFEKLLAQEQHLGITMRIPRNQVACLSPVFMVKKKTSPGKPPEYRKVVDCRKVNSEQVDIHFRMEGPETVQKLMMQNDWLVSLDLKSAFNHLLVSDAMRPFLCFEYDHVCYAYRAMPFGAKHSPRLFTEALGYAITYIRTHWSIRLVVYMDDILIMHQDRQVLELATWQIAAYLQYLGWTLSLEKCEFMPVQQIRFLGWWWDSRSLTLQMTPEMQSALSRLVRHTLQLAERNARMSSRALASLIGSLTFLRAQFPRASLYLRTCHSALTEMVSSVGWTGSCILPRRVSSELQFWLRNIGLNTAFCFAPRNSAGTLTTDACEQGWGRIS
jgi:hypothetical protein